MFPSRYISCPECGASVEREERLDHECERERFVEYQVFLHRAELEQLEEWLQDPSPEGAGGELDGK